MEIALYLRHGFADEDRRPVVIAFNSAIARSSFELGAVTLADASDQIADFDTTVTGQQRYLRKPTLAQFTIGAESTRPHKMGGLIKIPT